MGAKHGETIPSENRIRIREDVYERACNGYGRDRLTMAHELGHLLLHRVETITLAREDGDISPYKDPEWQTNDCIRIRIYMLALLGALKKEEILQLMLEVLS